MSSSERYLSPGISGKFDHLSSTLQTLGFPLARLIHAQMTDRHRRETRWPARTRQITPHSMTEYLEALKAARSRSPPPQGTESAPPARERDQVTLSAGGGARTPRRLRQGLQEERQDLELQIPRHIAASSGKRSRPIPSLSPDGRPRKWTQAPSISSGRPPEGERSDASLMGSTIAAGETPPKVVSSSDTVLSTRQEFHTCI